MNLIFTSIISTIVAAGRGRGRGGEQNLNSTKSTNNRREERKIDSGLMANPISQRWNHLNAVFARSINHLIQERDCQPAVTRRKTNVKFDFHEYLYNPVNTVGSPNRITVCCLVCTYVYISYNIIRINTYKYV